MRGIKQSKKDNTKYSNIFLLSLCKTNKLSTLTFYY